MANAHNILTGVKAIIFTPYKSTGELDTANAETLDSIIADTVAISQEDPTTNTIDCETSDSPIIEATNLGKYTVEMSSADIKAAILTKCLGFVAGSSTEGGTGAYFAPSSYTPIYAMLEIQMTGAEFVLPKVLLGSKIDASSLKTNVAKGTISGTAFDAKVKVGSATKSVTTPFLVVESESGSFPAITVEA